MKTEVVSHKKHVIIDVFIPKIDFFQREKNVFIFRTVDDSITTNYCGFILRRLTTAFTCFLFVYSLLGVQV